MNENKYHSTIRVEFRDLLDNLVKSERSSFPYYTVHRILSLGMLVDYTCRFERTEQEGAVAIVLDLKDFGKPVFILDIDSNYVKLQGEEDKEILRCFLVDFDTRIDKDLKRKKVF